MKTLYNLPLLEVFSCVIIMRCQSSLEGIHSILATCILNQAKVLENHNLYSISMTVTTPSSVTYSSSYVKSSIGSSIGSNKENVWI